MKPRPKDDLLVKPLVIISTILIVGVGAIALFHKDPADAAQSEPNPIQVIAENGDWTELSVTEPNGRIVICVQTKVEHHDPLSGRPSGSIALSLQCNDAATGAAETPPVTS